MEKTFGEKVIDFNSSLQFLDALPEGFQVLNPFVDNPETLQVMREFYEKYYNDHRQRRFIIGINPSRHGAGVTGIPFTDTKRLHAHCNILMQSARTHEVSSVFVYDMIQQYGGVEKFYSHFYINSPFPLAITRQTKNGNWLNANYYDDNKLFESVKHFMIDALKKHIDLGIDTREVYALGVKNAVFLERLNKEVPLFDNIVALEHPRYIQQYKSKEKQFYIDKYLMTFENDNSLI